MSPMSYNGNDDTQTLHIF